MHMFNSLYPVKLFLTFTSLRIRQSFKIYEGVKRIIHSCSFLNHDDVTLTIPLEDFFLSSRPIKITHQAPTTINTDPLSSQLKSTTEMVVVPLHIPLEVEVAKKRTLVVGTIKVITMFELVMGELITPLNIALPNMVILPTSNNDPRFLQLNPILHKLYPSLNLLNLQQILLLGTFKTNTTNSSISFSNIS